MSIKYTYEIVSVDETARCMEIIYKSDGNPTMNIGARLPYEGESVESIVEMFAPVRYWEENKLAVAPVELGLTGEITIPVYEGPTPEEIAEAEENARMWEQIEFEKKVAAALVKFGVLQSDPTKIQVSNL